MLELPTVKSELRTMAEQLARLIEVSVDAELDPQPG